MSGWRSLVEAPIAAEVEVLEDAGLDGMDRLRRVLDLILAEEDEAAAEGHAAGCMVVGSRMTPDIQDRDERVGHLLDRSLDRQLSLLAHAVGAGQRDGTVRTDLAPREVALLVVSTISGIRVLAQAGTRPDELRRVAALTLDALRP